MGHLLIGMVIGLVGGLLAGRLVTLRTVSQAEQRDFLLSISHELRTPLTAVRGFAEALADGVPGGDVRRRPRPHRGRPAAAFRRSALYQRYRGVRQVGTGLGLALVHTLGSRLGALFSIALPLLPPRGSQADVNWKKGLK